MTMQCGVVSGPFMQAGFFAFFMHGMKFDLRSGFLFSNQHGASSVRLEDICRSAIVVDQTRG